MNCIVTAGPTYESLDEVRRLTNFSTGRLGCQLAAHLLARGHQVVLLKGHYATFQPEPPAAELIPFTNTADLASNLHSLSARQVDVLFHTAAVSDFGFGQAFTRSVDGSLQPVTAGKFSTRLGPLLVELVPTRKIIAELRTWYPRTRLVGWKYEVDGSRLDALAAGRAQIQRCQTDGCVVNGPAYGEGFGWLSRGPDDQHWPDAGSLYAGLIRWAEEGVNVPGR